jgi:hypothetical protein
MVGKRDHAADYVFGHGLRIGVGRVGHWYPSGSRLGHGNEVEPNSVAGDDL